MSPERQRQITLVLAMVLVAGFAIRYAVQPSTAVEVRTIQESMLVSVTNDIAYFHGATETYWQKDRQLAEMLRRGKPPSMNVTVREHWKQGRRIAWEVVNVVGLSSGFG